MSNQNDLHEEILDIVSNIDARLESFIKELHIAVNHYQQTVVDLSNRFKNYEEYMRQRCIPAFHTIEQEKIMIKNELNNLKEKITDQKSVVNGHDKKIGYLDGSNLDISTRLSLVDKEVKEIKQIVQENSKINKSNEQAIHDINKEFEWLKRFKSQFQTALFALIITVLFSSIALVYTNFQTSKEIKTDQELKQELIDAIKKEFKK